MTQTVKTKKINRVKVLLMGMLSLLFGGISYSWGIIQPYIMKYYSLDASAASIPFSVNLGIFVVGCIIGGKLQIKYSIRKAFITGVIISFIGMFLTSIVPVRFPFALTVTFGLITGLGGGIVYNTLIAAMQQFFPDKKGMATGFILFMIGFSGFFMSPLINYALSNYSLSAMFMTVSFLGLIAGIAASIYVTEPPYGYMDGCLKTDNKTLTDVKQYAPREMLKTKYYYIIALSMFLAVPGFMLISPQFVLIGTERAITGTQAVSAVMFASISQACGRLAVPSLSINSAEKQL